MGLICDLDTVNQELVNDEISTPLGGCLYTVLRLIPNYTLQGTIVMPIKQDTLTT